MNEKKKYRFFLYSCLCAGICACLCTGYFACRQKIPHTIKIRAGTKEQMNFSLPASGELSAEGDKVIPVSLNQPLTFYANEIDSYEMNVKLFGFVPLKRVDVQVIPDTSLIPAGVPIGIYVKTEGVLVIDTGEFIGFDGNRYAPSENLLKKGDYILAMNGEKVTGKKMFMENLQKTKGNTVSLTVKRNKEVFDVRVDCLPDRAGRYKVGIWIRDNAQGVGTLTYLDENGSFGALGHGINDMDTSTLMSLEQGTLYHTDIVGVKKGAKGEPGELTGVIDYARENVIGNIQKNSETGIFGMYDGRLGETVETKPVPIGLKQEVQTGPASILCSVDSKEVCSYDVEILEIHYESQNNNRGIVLKITDSDLLEKTGGIVQGMSGAPILQNGKMIGAVTHVFVQDATKGYGIFIEEMLEAG